MLRYDKLALTAGQDAWQCAWLDRRCGNGVQQSQKARLPLHVVIICMFSVDKFPLVGIGCPS